MIALRAYTQTPIAADGDYDAFASFDSVPAIVESLELGDSKFWSILSAFVGVGELFVSIPRDFGTPS
jgi:hypothetical protein